MKNVERALYPLILIVSLIIITLIYSIVTDNGSGHGNPRKVAEQAIAAAYVKVDPATFNGHAYVSHYTIDGVPGESSDLSFAENDGKARQRVIDSLASRSIDGITVKSPAVDAARFIDGITVKSLAIDADHADKGTISVQAVLHTPDGQTEPCVVVLSFVDGGLKPQSTHCAKTQ